MLLYRFYMITTGIRQRKERQHDERTNDRTVRISSSTSTTTGMSVQKDGTAPLTNNNNNNTKQATVDHNSNTTSTLVIKGLIRTVFMDVPLLLVFLLHASCQWIDHVRIHYLYEQIQLLTFTNERASEEITYYQRPCTIDDITTFDGSDLFLPNNATVQDAYEHNLKHGFTIFRNVLQPQTAYNLRQYVDEQNYKLREQDKIFVIEGTNRYSFGLGTEEPTVAAAVKEVATSTTLQPALEAILGPNPALIEMTAITSSYGAIDQYWHDDVIASGSAINYARTFGPSYSVFIQLQNTTRTMGATGACPGTHYCSDGGMEVLCNTTKAGFQLVDKYNVPAASTTRRNARRNQDSHHHTNTSNSIDNDDNNNNNNMDDEENTNSDDPNQYEYWHEGDALLMNMNSFHRGSAHTDPYGLDRVMFILTFVPSPMDHAETRQLSQGITFSLRWDMWGHTLYDLAHSDTIMIQPWATLRALGLYKLSNTPTWGIDYITSACMRMANRDNGFRKRDLIQWINWGGFPYLPNFLEGKIDVNDGDDESWYEYYTRTLVNVMQFLEHCCWIGIGLYMMITILLLTPSSNKQNTNSTRKVAVWNASLRITSLVCIVAMLFVYMKHHVDETTWASDIRNKRRYGSTTSIEQMVFYNNDILSLKDYSESVSTFPTRHDVLIETRYGSEQLALYNDFINGHPGNRYYNDMIAKQIHAITTTTTKAKAAASTTFGTYPSFYQNAIAQWIVDRIVAPPTTTKFQNSGRFLYQNPNGYWLWISNDDAVSYTKKMIAIHTYPEVRTVLQTIRFLSSECKYGTYRYTALGNKHSIRYLQLFEKKLYQQSLNRNNNDPIINNHTIDNTTTTTTIVWYPQQSQQQATPSSPIRNKLLSSSMVFLQKPKQRIVGGGSSDDDGDGTIGPTSWKHRNHYTRLLDASTSTSMMMTLSLSNDDDHYPVEVPVQVQQQQQTIAWLTEGDMAEGYENNYWYFGVIESVTAHGDYRMVYPSGGRDTIDRYTIRPFVPYIVQEPIQYYVKRQHQFYNATIVFVGTPTEEEQEYEDEEENEPLLRVYVSQLDRIYDVKQLDEIRRYGQPEETKIEYQRAY